ncbi:MAG: diguanylate cyclase, partial [Armatimonadota bacterium]|nr:diguanylate cyclase [Armatimonadota bacterium]
MLQRNLHPVLWYIVLAGFSVLLTDRVLHVLIEDPARLQDLRPIQGLVSAIISVLLFYVLVVLDQRARQRSQRAIEASEERYALAAQGANDGLWDWNVKTDEIYYSPRWKSMLGYAENEIGASPDEWFNRIHPEDAKRVQAEMAAHRAGQKSHFESEYRMRHRDGTYLWVLTRGLAVRDATGTAYRMAGSQSDITERKVAEDKLLHNAFYDALTGLPNRALLMDRLGHALQRTKRKPDYLFAVLFMDLDRFKVINDSLGHLVGDQLLVAVARRLRTCLRPTDTIARLGGDEFTILLDDIRNADDAILVADRIQHELRLPFSIEHKEVFTGASVGIALSASGYVRAEDLLRDADTALYQAKSQGKARHEIFDAGMHVQAVARMQLETDLRHALERQEWCLYYQPILSLESGQVTSFEALVRWHHPERGLVPPATFIPVAEETGVIVAIGWWVLREACRQLRAWQTQYPGNEHLTISVNLSAKQFNQPPLVERIEEILQE